MWDSGSVSRKGERYTVRGKCGTVLDCARSHEVTDLCRKTRGEIVMNEFMNDGGKHITSGKITQFSNIVILLTENVNFIQNSKSLI